MRFFRRLQIFLSRCKLGFRAHPLRTLKWPSQPLYGSFIRYRVGGLSSIQAFLAYESITFGVDLMPKGPPLHPLPMGCPGMSLHPRSMTNSTPTILIWVNQYKKYQQLIEQGLSDEASGVKREIDEALPLIDLTWKDLEQAASDEPIP